MIERLRDFRPRFLQAYPSAATIIARFMLKHETPRVESLRAVLCGSENLYDWQRTLIEEAFGRRVYGWYGQSECVALAGECEHSHRLHVFPQYGFTELLDQDGKAVTEPGGVGEIVATSLHARAMPLIRYRTGDVGVRGAELCSLCGRPYQLFERIEGRLHEFIVSSTGRYISMTAINMHSDVFENVRQFRFLQEERGHVKLLVRASPEFSLATDRPKIQAALRPKLGSDMSLEIELVDDLPPSRSGKFHFLDQRLSVALTQ